MKGLLAVFAVLIAAGPAAAGEADVLNVVVRSAGPGSWRFDVTVRHADEGWDHYADKWG